MNGELNGGIKTPTYVRTSPAGWPATQRERLISCALSRGDGIPIPMNSFDQSELPFIQLMAVGFDHPSETVLQ